jgi:hypothetical protein
VLLLGNYMIWPGVLVFRASTELNSLAVVLSRSKVSINKPQVSTWSV